MKTTASIEPLEARIAPAGVVAVAYDAVTGELTLTGDALGNTLDVIKTGSTTHRIQTTGDTTLTGGALARDIGKLTKLTILAGDGNDSFALENLTALTQLSLDAGAGGGQFTINNTKVAGPVNFTGGAGSDFFTFGGLSATVSGNLTVNDTAGGRIDVDLGAQTNVLGGSVLFTGGAGLARLEANGAGTLVIGKGVSFQAGSGGSSLGLHSLAGTTIGKLSTGESIRFTGSDLSDDLSFSSKSVALAGGLRMEGGEANDSLIFDVPGGAVKIGRLSTGESISFDAGEGDDVFYGESLSFRTAGSIGIVGGQGAFDCIIGSLGSAVSIGKQSNGASIQLSSQFGNSFTLKGTSIALAGGIDFASTGGNNSLTIAADDSAKIGKLLDGASIDYSGSIGLDTLTAVASRLTFAGGIDFAGGEGLNSINLGDQGTRVLLGKLLTGESLRYVGGAGIDTVLAQAAALVAAGGVAFAGGDGANAVQLFNANASTTIGKLTTGQSVLYTGGAGTDEFRSIHARTALVGGIEFSGGDNENQLLLDSDGMVQIGTIATGQSVKFTGGSGPDDLFLGGSSVLAKGSIEMTGGAGDNNLDLDGPSVTVGQRAGISTLLVGGAGRDEIDFEDNVTLAGSLVLEGNAGDDTLDLASGTRLNVGGDIRFRGDADNDRLDLDAFALQIGGKVTFSGGDGNDGASILADGRIAGDVMLDLGGASAGGIQGITLQSFTGIPLGLVLKGALDITANGAAGTFDTLTVRDVAVHKAINAALGAGISSVVINNLAASDTFTLATGDGADVVEIERSDLFGDSVIAKLATIQTGAGNDTVLIGSATPPLQPGFPDSTRVRFLGGLAVDGGADTDTRNTYAAENTITGTPTIQNFEQGSV